MIIALDPQTSLEPWAPLPNLGGELLLEKLEDNAAKLKITLKSENGRAIRIELDEPRAYRVSLRTVDSEYLRFAGEAEAHGSFWRATSSAWSARAAENLEAEKPAAVHYLLLTEQEIIEFLTSETPHVSWLDNFFGDAN